jgi:hypothetical protein
VKLGVWLPAVAAHPRFPTPDWERTAGAGELAIIALAADELGYDCVCAPEHVALPVGRGEGTQYWDPLTTLGYLAAKTRRIRLAPLVVVLGYHHPLEIVKRYGTLDLISGGRAVLGVGVGGTEGEFALLAELDPGQGRDPAFDVVFLPRAEQVTDPLGDPDGTRSFLARLRAAGVTTLLPRILSQSAGHYTDQLAALAPGEGR